MFEKRLTKAGCFELREYLGQIVRTLSTNLFLPYGTTLSTARPYLLPDLEGEESCDMQFGILEANFTRLVL